MVLFDPQSAYLPNISAANPGKRIEYVSSSAISLYEDQFLPYCAFGCDMKSPFHGTLFRFPLRNTEQAAKSQLSKQVYLEDDLSSMFGQLYEEGILSLLFLKCVLSIEMYVWEAGTTEPRKLFSCCIDLAGEKVVGQRQALLRFSKSTNYSDFRLADFSLDFLSEAVIDDVSYKRKHRFFVVQMMASPSSRIGSFSNSAAKDYDLHLLPWGSVAACISDDLLDVILSNSIRCWVIFLNLSTVCSGIFLLLLYKYMKFLGSCSIMFATLSFLLFRMHFWLGFIIANTGFCLLNNLNASCFMLLHFLGGK